MYLLFLTSKIVDIHTFIYGVNHGHKMANSMCISRCTYKLRILSLIGDKLHLSTSLSNKDISPQELDTKIRRSGDWFEDSSQVLGLLNSAKFIRLNRFRVKNGGGSCIKEG